MVRKVQITFTKNKEFNRVKKRKKKKAPLRFNNNKRIQFVTVFGKTVYSGQI